MTTMGMPKATIDEDGFSPRRKNYVWGSREVAPMQAKSVA
jgi:hypothetical protein